MDPSDTRPIQPGRLPPLKLHHPTWHAYDESPSLAIVAWALSDRVYPPSAAVSVDPTQVTESMRVLDHMRGGGSWHTVPIEVSGWGIVTVGGMVDQQDRAGRLVVTPTLDWTLVRDLVGLQIGVPLEWTWMHEPQLADLMAQRARVMLMGLVATWIRTQTYDLGPSGAVLHEYSRQWTYEGDLAVGHPEWWLDLRDPTTWTPRR